MDGARATVVVANADETVCEVLARIVEAAGYEAVRITDPEQVASAVVSAPADALVVDLGPATVDQLRSLRAADHPRAASARAIVISTGPANALLAWQAGADAVLTRPFAADALREALAGALALDDEGRTARRHDQIEALTPS